MRGTRHRWLGPLALLWLLAGAVRAEDVGRLVEAVGEVKGTPSGGSEAAMALGDGFALGHAIATGSESAARLSFLPGGALKLYAETRVVIDRAVLDAAGRSESRLSLLLGRLRLALSSLFQGELEVDTPAATIGIKGTVLEIFVDADGRTVVLVVEGEVEVRARSGGEPLLLGEGFWTEVTPGGRPRPAAPYEPGSALLGPTSKGPGFDGFNDALSAPVTEPLIDPQRPPGIVSGDPP